MSLSKLWEIVKDRKDNLECFCPVTKSQTQLSKWTTKRDLSECSSLVMGFVPVCGVKIESLRYGNKNKESSSAFTCFFSFLHQTVSSVGVSETEGFECFFTLLTSSLAHLSQLHGYWQKTWDSWVRNTQWSNSGGSVSFRLLHQLPSSVKFRLMLHTQGWHHSSGTLCLRNPNHLSRAASKPDLGLGGSHLYYMT